MELLTAIMIYFGVLSPDPTMDFKYYNSLIINNQETVQSYTVDPTTGQLMIRNIDRRED